MARESANQAIRQVRTLYTLGSAGGLTDAQLVERFLGGEGIDREEAFAALVRRHGPMVLRVCRRMLAGSPDAEDACQAVFLVLARRAGAVRGAERLKLWLYGVAVRTAKTARRGAARRRAREGGEMDESRIVTEPAEGRDDRLVLLDEEIARLPGRYRTPLLLCELEGASRQDAARRLGIPEGTLSSRLARGRSLLRDRLAKRGVALGAGTLAALLPEPANATLPSSFVDATVRLALTFAAGGAMAGIAAAGLARAVGRMTSPWTKTIPAALAALATAAAPRALFTIAVVAGGVLAVALAGQVGVSEEARLVKADHASPVAHAAPDPDANPDPDDPLPAGATLRLGVTRFRHSTTIQGLAVSRDGKVAVASSGTLVLASVRAYDLATGRVRLPFPEATDVEAVALSPDGKTLAATRVASAMSPAVYLYSMVDGKETARIPYPGSNPSSSPDLILFAPDGTHVVIKSSDGTALHRIELATRGLARTYPAPGTVFAAALSPDGKRLVAGGFDYDEGGERFARQWEVDTGRELAPLATTPGTIRSIAYSPDGATIAAGIEARDTFLKLFDAANGEERRTIPLPDANSLRSVAFSPDGKTIAASGDSTTRLFDAATGEERWRIDRNATGLRFAPDGATLVGAVAGTIHRWDASSGRSLIPEGGESPVAQVAATPDGRRLVSLGQDGDGHIWDARTGAHQRRLDMGWQRGFALSPDGRFLVWPMPDRSIEFPDADMHGVTRIGTRLRLFDLEAGAVVGRGDDGKGGRGADREIGVPEGAFIDRFDGFEGDVQDLFFIDGGKTLVTVEHYRRDANVRLWDVASGRVTRSFPASGGPRERAWSSRLSPDGKVLAVSYQQQHHLGLAAAGGQPLKLWDLATGKKLDTPPPHWAGVELMTFTPDGKTIAAPTSDGKTIRFLDATTGQIRGEFRDLPDRVTALAFAPDGRLFTGAPDGTILAWPPRPADRK